MADKPYKQLDHADAVLRMTSPVGMEDGVKQLIIRHCGFELYNSRPYHNYETWSDGYIILSRKDGKATTAEWLLEQWRANYKERDENFLVISREDLDDAAIELADKMGAKEKVMKHLNAILDQRSSRAIRLRKKFQND